MTYPYGAFRMTIALGVGFGLALAPLSTGLALAVPDPLAFRLVLWGYLAIYGYLLSRWGGVGPGQVLLPLISLLGILVLGDTRLEDLTACLPVLSWMRSGVCFAGRPFKAVMGEILIAWGGGFAVACFRPATIWAFALAICLFFLIQSLYFPLFLDRSEASGVDEGEDGFDRARREAEKILAA